MGNLGIELELGLLLGIVLLGAEIFAPFEIETPVWRKILKWAVVVGATLALYRFAGHWAAMVSTALATVGLLAHLVWCNKNGIHPFRATPRRRYDELRGWEWRTSAVIFLLAPDANSAL